MAYKSLFTLEKESASIFITPRGIPSNMRGEFLTMMDDACQTVCGENKCTRQIFTRGDNLVISGRDVGRCSMLNNLRFHRGKISFRFYYQCQENCPFVLAIRNRLNQNFKPARGFCLPVSADIGFTSLYNKLAATEFINELRIRVSNHIEPTYLDANICCTQADYSGLPQLADEHGFRLICLLSNIPNDFIVLTH